MHYASIHNDSLCIYHFLAKTGSNLSYEFSNSSLEYKTSERRVTKFHYKLNLSRVFCNSIFQVIQTISTIQHTGRGDDSIDRCPLSPRSIKESIQLFDKRFNTESKRAPPERIRPHWLHRKNSEPEQSKNFFSVFNFIFQFNVYLYYIIRLFLKLSLRVKSKMSIKSSLKCIEIMY